LRTDPPGYKTDIVHEIVAADFIDIAYLYMTRNGARRIGWLAPRFYEANQSNRKLAIETNFWVARCLHKGTIAVRCVVRDGMQVRYLMDQPD
jgi:hypothetical protein